MQINDAVKLIYGYCVVEVACDFERFVSYLIRTGIAFWSVLPRGDGSASLRIWRRDMAAVEKARERFEVKITAQRGVVPYIAARIKRPGLVVGVLICLLVSFGSTFFVWDVRVSGNHRLSAAQVSAMLSAEGFRAGQFIPSLSIRRINNVVVLKHSAEIQWISINLHGTVANVEVREKPAAPVVIDDRTPINIVAIRGGQIKYMDVYQGQPVVKVGDAVVPGQLLVSSLIDSKTVGLRVSHAAARVEALTNRVVEIFIPWTGYKKVYTNERDLRFSVRILEKNIKFYNSSSISLSKYDKIVRSERIRLLGKIALPAYLITSELKAYTMVQYTLTPEQARTQANQRLNDIIACELKGAQISSRSVYYKSDERGLTMTCKLECVEDIAAEQPISDHSGFVKN